MDASVEDVVDVLGRAAAIYLGDVSLRVVGVAVDGVVGHVACRIVGEAAGRDLVVGRVDRWIEIIARLQGSLRNAIAVAIVSVSVVLQCTTGHSARGQPVETVTVAVGDLLVQHRIGEVCPSIRDFP